MDSMLKDATYHGELEELRRNAADAPPSADGTGGPGTGSAATGAPGDASEEDSQVSTSEALDMLRQARAALILFCCSLGAFVPGCLPAARMCHAFSAGSVCMHTHLAGHALLDIEIRTLRVSMAAIRND
jgi:hypothetical protein